MCLKASVCVLCVCVSRMQDLNSCRPFQTCVCVCVCVCVQDAGLEFLQAISLGIFPTSHVYVLLNNNSVQFISVAQSCPTLCGPMDSSMSGFPVYHQFLEITQTHVHRVGDAIKPSHPLSSPSHPIFNLSQYQGLLE